MTGWCTYIGELACFFQIILISFIKNIINIYNRSPNLVFIFTQTILFLSQISYYMLNLIVYFHGTGIKCLVALGFFCFQAFWFQEPLQEHYTISLTAYRYAVHRSARFCLLFLLLIESCFIFVLFWVIHCGGSLLKYTFIPLFWLIFCVGMIWLETSIGKHFFAQQTFKFNQKICIKLIRSFE